MIRMQTCRIQIHSAYDPDLAADYDGLLSSLHMAPTIHVPDEMRRVCESDTSIMYLGMVNGHAAVMGTLLKPADSIGHRTAVFEDIAVQPGYRGMGLGVQMVEHLIAESSRLGATRIELHSKDARVEAHTLYKKLGFEIIDTRLFRKVLRAT